MIELYTLLDKLGLLKAYKFVMKYNSGYKNAYHNNFHLESVCNIALKGCKYHIKMETGIEELPYMDEECMKLVALAALFHDFNHFGGGMKDELNIQNAKIGLLNYLVDTNYNDISENNKTKKYQIDILYGLIDATEYPYTIPNEELNLLQKILRDADILQGVFCQNYINGVVKALSDENSWSFEKMISGEQEKFLLNTKFSTDWAQKGYDERLPFILHKIDIVKKSLNS